MKRHSRSAGFTLVEIAIVLVIIGLLLGGIMKGQSMIKSAKIKSVKVTFTNTATAIYAYQDLTKYLPGDDPNSLHANKGDGDGAIGNGEAWSAADGDDAQESPNVWGHLATQDLVNLSHREQNIFKSGTTVGIGSEILSMDGEVVCLNKIPNDVARLIDLTLDDGVGNTGDLRGGGIEAAAGLGDAVAYADQGDTFTNDIDLCNKI